MSHSKRNRRLIAALITLSGLVPGPISAAVAPALDASQPPSAQLVASAQPLPRVLRRTAATGRPIDLEERLRTLREHGRNFRSQGAPPQPTSTPAQSPVRPQASPERER